MGFASRGVLAGREEEGFAGGARPRVGDGQSGFVFEGESFNPAVREQLETPPPPIFSYLILFDVKTKKMSVKNTLSNSKPGAA